MQMDKKADMGGFRSHCRHIGHETGYQPIVTATRQKASTRSPISVSGAENACYNASSLPQLDTQRGFFVFCCVSRRPPR